MEDTEVIIMKKNLLVLLIIMMSGVYLAADTDYDSLQSSFEDFSSDLAEALPYASTTGLNWSEAYLGGFPHFGVGVTTGFVTLPSDGFEDVAETLGVELPDLITDYGIGVPLPAYTVDARVGIPFLPIDVGVKGGVLEPSWLEDTTGVGIDYLLLGADVRYGIMKQGLIKPDISIGLGYNYLKGGLYIDDATSSQSISLGVDYDGDGDDDSITVSSGDMYYEWEAHVIDAKLQASKSFLILTPSVGLGYAYGFSTVGGGIDATVTDEDGDEISSSYISEIESALDMDLSSTGISIFSEDESGSLRVWGGCSFNIVVLKLDLSVVYNITSESMGGSLNARVQL
jgi:hypothetical protein